MLYQLTRMSNAFLRGKTKQAVPAQISHAFRVRGGTREPSPRKVIASSSPLHHQGFPQKMQYSSQSPVDIAVEIGKTTFPFGLSFLLPIFVLTLVKEKEDRILIMLRMNGLTTFVYYATHYMHFMVLQAVASVVFIITGFVTNINFCTSGVLPLRSCTHSHHPLSHQHGSRRYPTASVHLGQYHDCLCHVAVGVF